MPRLRTLKSDEPIRCLVATRAEGKEMTRYDPDPNLPDSVAIDLIRLRPSIKRALLAAGLKTVGDIRRASDQLLLSIQNLGKGSLTRLRNALGRRDRHSAQ